MEAITLMREVFVKLPNDRIVQLNENKKVCIRENCKLPPFNRFHALNLSFLFAHDDASPSRTN